MLSKDDELDLLSEEEGDNLQDFKLGESQTQRADEDNLMSPDAFSAQKLSLTQRYDHHNDRSAMAPGSSNQAHSVERSQNDAQNNS